MKKGSETGINSGENGDKARIYGFEKYISMETLATLSGIVTSTGTFDQARKIWTTCKPEAVSMPTWSVYLLGSIVRLLYGIKHRKKPIILTNSIGILAEVTIILGIIYCNSLPQNNLNSQNGKAEKSKIELTSAHFIENISVENIFQTKDWEILIERQLSDYKKFGNFMNIRPEGTKEDSDLENRTAKGRLKDSESFIEAFIRAGDIVVDIGSGLGNPDNKEAGITVRELYENNKINEAASVILASDIEKSTSTFSKMHGRYKIKYKTIDQGDFNTPIKIWINEEGFPRNRAFLRSANGIDVLMNEDEALSHFVYLSATLFENEVFYMFNKHILHKQANSNKFIIIGELNNAGFDHKSSDGEEWVQNRGRIPYILY